MNRFCLSKSVNPVFCLGSCRIVKIIAVKDNIMTELQIQPIAAADLVCDHELNALLELAYVFLSLSLLDPACEFCVSLSHVCQEAFDLFDL